MRILDDKKVFYYSKLIYSMEKEIKLEIKKLENEVVPLYKQDYKLIKDGTLQSVYFHKEVYEDFLERANIIDSQIDQLKDRMLAYIVEQEGPGADIEFMALSNEKLDNIPKYIRESFNNSLSTVKKYCKDMLEDRIRPDIKITLNTMQNLEVSLGHFPYTYLSDSRAGVIKGKIDIDKKHFKKAGLDVKDIEEFIQNLRMMLSYQDGYDTTIFNQYLKWLRNMENLTPPFTLNIFAIKRKKEQNRKELQALLDLYKPKQSTKQQTDLVEIQTIKQG